MTKTKYYSPKLLFSHNAIINIVMSNRGGGKTYSGKDFMVENLKKNGKQSVYIRRTVEELKKAKKTFFNSISKKYPNDEFKIDGNVGYINGEVLVYFIALSTSITDKSSELPDVTFIMFDEYIIPMKSYARYIPGEAFMLLELIFTIGRDRNDYKVYICGNAISYVNPLFTYFNIEPDSNKKFQKFKDNMICLELYTNKLYQDEIMKTRFGKLIEGTDYCDYAVYNNVYEDTEDFIMPRNGKEYRFISSFKTNGYEIGVWLDIDKNIFYCDNKVDPSSKNKYTLRNTESEKGYKNISSDRSTSWRVRDVKTRFINGELYFINQEVKRFFQNEVIRFI